jgi:hypothetical protein
MEPNRIIGNVWLRFVALAVLGVLVGAVLVLNTRFRKSPRALFGAITQKNDDSHKQSPVAGVDVTLAGQGPETAARSDPTGYFRIPLPPGVRQGDAITLLFREAKYEPLQLNTTVADKLYVVQMRPLVSEDVPSDHPAVAVTNVFVRYSIETHAEVNVGTGLKTFQVVNVGDIVCNGHAPCSPDAKWKAAVGSASLDAGQGNTFQNARVSCIAGPCPFTKIESDGFSQGGRTITVSVRNWSDTTTFLLEAEVFRQQVSDIVRQSYPVIFGETLNFSLPAAAEGPSLEAELGGVPITFPLGPDPVMSWAACGVITARDHSKSYRCELARGFKFQ